MAEAYRLLQVRSSLDRSDEALPLISAAQLVDLLGKHFSVNGYCVAYLDNQVLIGRFEEQQLLFYDGAQIDPRFLQRLRMFSDEQELLLWRTGQGFRWRKRIDGLENEGSMVEAVEAEQILWGTKSEALTRGWTRLFEGRGMELILPMDSAEVTPVNRVKLTTRNYIGYNALGQAGYIDCRFVRFTIGR